MVRTFFIGVVGSIPYTCALRQQLCPDADFTQDLGAQIDRDNWQNERDKRMLQFDSNAAGMPTTFQSAARLSTTAWPAGGPSQHISPGDLSPSDDELGNATLTEGLKTPRC